MAAPKDEMLEILDIDSFETALLPNMQQRAIKALENGKVLYFPRLSFPLSSLEKKFLSPAIADPKTKNISYDIRTDKLAGYLCHGEDAQNLKEMVKRYATNSRKFFEQLFPTYSNKAQQARTSYRPVEASGRNLSYRKDDTRLHVDAFPATPQQGKRILRIFTNVNPHGMPRVWRLGEPFPDVVETMAKRVKKPVPGSALLMKLLKITKGYRTPYDHYMLKIHDSMKEDLEYQREVRQQEVRFPAGSTWIVYSDQVSHAAMSGQFLFEQTFQLPVDALQDETTSPLRTLERYLNCKLV